MRNTALSRSPQAPYQDAAWLAYWPRGASQSLWGNVLHWAGIHESILDLCATVRPHFVIADAIVAMEGDGRLNGIARRLSSLVLADDPVAGDSCCTELLGVAQTSHVVEAGRFLGNRSRASIDEIA